MAGALVGEPQILILDEPTVGLDPKQITEIRSLIKKLGKNHTVILSSHILSEVSQICDKVIIINKGKLIAIDTPNNLEDKVANDNSVYVTVEDTENKMETIKDKLENATEVKLVAENEDKTKKYVISTNQDIDLRKNIFDVFAKEGITIFEMKKADATLEDAFMELINLSNEDLSNTNMVEEKSAEEKKLEEKGIEDDNNEENKTEEEKEEGGKA